MSLEWTLFAWLWAELLSEPLFLESEDNASEAGEQELLCSSTRVASLWSDAVPAEESYIVILCSRGICIVYEHTKIIFFILIYF